MMELKTTHTKTRTISAKILMAATLLAAFLGFSPCAQSAPDACKNLFVSLDARVSKIVGPDAFAQWIKWEQLANFANFRKSSTPLRVNAVPVARENLEIKSIKNLDPELVNALGLNNGQVLWLKHPFNTSGLVPFLYLRDVQRSFTAYYTASRSLVLDGFTNAYTIKMPTDHPHGPQGEYQPSKAKTVDDILTGLVRTDLVDRVDAQIGKDDKLIVAREVLTVAEKTSGQGYLLRDVSFMKDGHYYLPAFSLPYVGRQIARLHNQDPNLFWARHYAEALGQAKARLLLRYGLQLETPNTQNMLIQLDRNLRPTGRIVIRDLSDTFFIDQIGQALGFAKEMKVDIENNYQPKTKLDTAWRAGSSWRLDEAGKDSFPSSVLDQWGRQEAMAYKNEIQSALNVTITSRNTEPVASTQDFLLSEIGLRKLRSFREKLKKQRPTGAVSPVMREAL